MTRKTSINLDTRVFSPVENSEGGAVDDRTQFHFLQNGETFTAKYSGGHISQGHIIGKFTSGTTADILYHCLIDGGELKAGRANANFTVDNNGHVTMLLEWAWVSGAVGSGTSKYLEITRTEKHL